MASRARCAAGAAVSLPMASTKVAVTAAFLLTDDRRKGAALPAKRSRKYQGCEQRLPFHSMVFMSHKTTMTMLL